MKRIVICFDGTWNKPPGTRQGAGRPAHRDQRVPILSVDKGARRRWDQAIEVVRRGCPLRWMQDKPARSGWLSMLYRSAQKIISASSPILMRNFSAGFAGKKTPATIAPVLMTQFGNETIDDSVARRRKEDRTFEPQNNGLPRWLKFQTARWQETVLIWWHHGSPR